MSFSLKPSDIRKRIDAATTIIHSGFGSLLSGPVVVDGRELSVTEVDAVIDRMIARLDNKKSSGTIDTMNENNYNHPIVKYFENDHLAEGDIKDVSNLYKEFAFKLDALLKPSPESTVAIRKLLESKDSAVRSALDGVTR